MTVTQNYLQSRFIIDLCYQSSVFFYGQSGNWISVITETQLTRLPVPSLVTLNIG